MAGKKTTATACHFIQREAAVLRKQAQNLGKKSSCRKSVKCQSALRDAEHDLKSAQKICRERHWSSNATAAMKALTSGALELGYAHGYRH